MRVDRFVIIVADRLGVWMGVWVIACIDVCVGRLDGRYVTGV